VSTDCDLRLLISTLLSPLSNEYSHSLKTVQSCNVAVLVDDVICEELHKIGEGEDLVLM
jgi:hypothetical protein